MAATKLYDLAVVVSTYTNAQGEKKNRYQNVGAVMQSDQGGKFIMLERWFNPAGVPNPDNRSNVLLSMFEPRDNNNAGGGQQQAPRQQQAPAARPAPSDDFDDNIPF